MSEALEVTSKMEMSLDQIIQKSNESNKKLKVLELKSKRNELPVLLLKRRPEILLPLLMT